MNKYLEQLVTLSNIDKEIDSFDLKEENINKTLKEAESKITKIEADLINLDEEIKDIQKQKIENNNLIAEFAAKIKDLSKKSGQVKTEKEANALKIEEDIAREQLDAANEEILRLDKILENKENFKKELSVQKTQEEAKIKDLKAKISAQIEELQNDKNRIYARKNEIVGEINQKMLSFYERIRKWAKNTAVVPVKKQACHGCFMKIYDKTYLSIQKSKEIITCPHCGRILYLEAEENN